MVLSGEIPYTWNIFKIDPEIITFKSFELKHWFKNVKFSNMFTITIMKFSDL